MGVVRGLLPQAEAAGFAPAFTFDPTARLLAAIAGGARGDVAILTQQGAAQLAAQGVLLPGTRRDLARSVIGMAVRSGAPKPDIATPDALRAALLAAPSIAYTAAGASGIFLAGLIERMGIAEQVRAKATIIPQGLSGELAARGEVALAIQQVSELMAVPGVDIVGPLPPEANEALVFTAARFAGGDPAAEGFIAWLAGALTPAVLRAGGLEPV
jgi:molybdate transport system substrate-binding protein